MLAFINFVPVATDEIIPFLGGGICLGKRRYDRKQSGFGGQTKPVFHKKVCYLTCATSIDEICHFLDYCF